jgi:hypothetical protein
MIPNVLLDPAESRTVQQPGGGGIRNVAKAVAEASRYAGGEEITANVVAASR